MFSKKMFNTLNNFLFYFSMPNLYLIFTQNNAHFIPVQLVYLVLPLSTWFRLTALNHVPHSNFSKEGLHSQIEFTDLHKHTNIVIYGPSIYVSILVCMSFFLLLLEKGLQISAMIDCDYSNASISVTPTTHMYIHTQILKQKYVNMCKYMYVNKNPLDRLFVETIFNLS